MYSPQTQKKVEYLLYFMVLIVFVQMPFRYIHLFLHDESFWSMASKYVVVGASGFFLFWQVLIYMTMPSLDRRFDIHQFRDIAILVFCMSIMGVLAGFFNGGRVYYVVGDAFRHISPWLFFFVFLWIFQVLLSAGRIEVVERVFTLMAFAGVIESLATYAMRYYDPSLRMSTNLYTWTMLWGLYQRRYSFLIVWPAVLLSISTPIVSGKRSAIILLAIAVVIYGVYIVRELISRDGGGRSSNRYYVFKQILTVIFVLMIVLMMLPVMTQEMTISQDSVWLNSAIKTIDNVFEIVTGKTQDASFEGRWVEWSNIVEYMKTRPDMWIWGAGFGAEFIPSDSNVVLTKEGTMHNVHQAWAAYFLRSGCLGFFLFFWFFAKIVWYFFVGSRNYANWQYFCITIVLYCVVGSFNSNVMLETYGEGFFVGLLYCLVHCGGNGVYLPHGSSRSMLRG